MEQQSVYIIKPEGMVYRHEIHEMIMEANLIIVDSLSIVLPEWVLRRLYPDVVKGRRKLWSVTLEQLTNDPCEIGIVQGENAVRRLLRLCGKETRPPQCKVGSIRARFGTQAPVPAGQVVYWKNVIHRPQNNKEALRDLEIADRFLFKYPTM